MSECDYVLYEYGREDGTIQTEEEFYAEHHDINMSPNLRRRMNQNLENQVCQIVKEFRDKDIKIEGYCATFVYKDEETAEFYLKPLYELDVKVYIKKQNLLIIIYDIRMS